jgi:hypothetical protein
MMAVAGLLVVTGCGTSQPASVVGVHIDGAITAVYPISSGATCNLARVNADAVLQFSTNAKTGAAVGIELIKYKGAGVYRPLDWPPYESSALWVGLIGGQTWRAHSGQVTVVSDVKGKISGTLAASGMQEVDGITTVNASGSWTCQLLAT